MHAYLLTFLYKCNLDCNARCLNFAKAERNLCDDTLKYFSTSFEGLCTSFDFECRLSITTFLILVG